MPQSLSWLLETKQALEVIPGVLYFVSIGEKLPSVEEGLRTSTTKKNSLSVSKQCQDKENGAFSADHIERIAVSAALEAFPKDRTRQLSSASTGRQPLEKLQQKRRKSELENASGVSTPRVLRRVRSTSMRSLLLCHQLFSDSGNDGDIGALFHKDAFFFSVSESSFFQYSPLFADFGPLDLHAVTRFSQCLQGLLGRSAQYEWKWEKSRAVFGPASNGSVNSLQPSHESAEKTRRASWTGRSGADGTAETQSFPIVFCSRLNNHDRANAACLLACFCVSTLRWSAAATWRLFQEAYPPIVPFRDASYGVSAFPLTLLDVLSGLEKAIAHGWYDTQSFDVAEYDRLKGFDCSWIVPRVFLAFSSPQDDKPGRSAKTYANLLKQVHVTHVIRLNESMYNREKFLSNGVRHVDMELPEGISLNDDVVTRFMRVTESILVAPPNKKCSSNLSISSKDIRFTSSRTPSPMPNASPTPPRRVSSRGNQPETPQSDDAAIAVHCCAGLGRTGTVICVYMMQHYDMTARECIGWMRLCRPGSVIGVQQQFLETIERRLTRPTRCTDILRAEYHTRVIGAGVVDSFSRYTYQPHGLLAAPGRWPARPFAEDRAASSAANSLSVSSPCRSSYFLALGRRPAARLRGPRAWRSEPVACLTPPRLQALVRQWRGVGGRGEGLETVTAAVRLLPAPPAAARETHVGRGPGWGAPAARLGREQRVKARGGGIRLCDM